MYKICSQCVMDTSDKRISFNENMVCEYCQNFSDFILPTWNYGKNREKDLEKLISQIKQSGVNKEYDCILGLSGGLDSAYLAHIAVKEVGLRPLFFHVDVGWNTQESVNNINLIVDKLGADLFTHVVDWSAMKSMQRAYFKSGLPDIDYPQDIAYTSALYMYARKFKVKYILNGGNFSTECCREPEDWGGYLGVDKWFVNSVFKKYGDGSIDGFPLVDILRYKILYKYIYNLTSVYPLNYISYTRDHAQKTLTNEYGCSTFKHKHHESVFTRFYEDFWLPKRFGYEKRRAHLSSLIMTKQISRNEALIQLKEPVLSSDNHKKDYLYISKKLGFSKEEFDKIFSDELNHYSNFKNKRNLILLGAKILRSVGLEKRLFR